jgi:hypothetical protein
MTEVFGFSGDDARQLSLNTLKKTHNIPIHQILSSLRFHRNKLAKSILRFARGKYRDSSYEFIKITYDKINIDRVTEEVDTYGHVSFVVGIRHISNLYIQNLLFALKSFFKGFDVTVNETNTRFSLKVAEKEGESITYMSEPFDFDRSILKEDDFADIIKEDEWILDLPSIIKLIRTRQDELDKEKASKQYTDDIIIKYIKENAHLLEKYIKDACIRSYTQYSIIYYRNCFVIPIKFYEGAFYIGPESSQIDSDYLIEFLKRYFKDYKIKIDETHWIKKIILDWSDKDDKED